MSPPTETAIDEISHLPKASWGSGSVSRGPRAVFFLWLEVGDGEAATKRLWREGGIRVLPGAYMCGPDAEGVNPGGGYIRVALVHDSAVTEMALGRLREIL